MQKNANETAKETKNMFLQSAKELKAVTTLAACAMFAALAMILNQVASIDIGPYVRIGFSGIPNRLVDYLFGPVTGCLFSGILDVVKYFLKPSGPFFFGFTFNAMLASFMYGCFYYRKKLTIKRVLAAKFIVMLTVNVLLNTLWLSMLYGKGIMVLLPARALKNLIMWPIDSIIFYSLTKLIEQTGVFRMFHARTAAQAQNKEKFRHHQNDTFTNLQKRYCPPEQKGSGWVLSEKKSEKELRQELPQKEACRSSFCMKIPSGGQRFY